jgi:hypothetical protein
MGDRFRVWRGVELVGDVSRTVFRKKKNECVLYDPVVQGPQTTLEKGVNVGGIVDHGQMGQDGHESNDLGDDC